MPSLIIKNDGIGDLVLSSGLIADVARELGEVDLVTCASNREIAENIPGLRRRLYVSRDALQYRPWPLRLGLRWRQGTPGDEALLRELRGTTYDHAVCLRRFIRQSTLILMRNVRARHRACAWLYPTNTTVALAKEHSAGWEHYRGESHGSELTYYRRFLEPTLGIRSTSGPTLRCAKPSESNGTSGRIGLAIGGGSTNWPAGHWLELARGLGREGWSVEVFGGADASPLARQMKDSSPRLTDQTGALSFEQAADHLSGLDLLVGNDTGFTHFATLCCRHVLVILGGGTFGRFFPWPEATNQSVIFRAMECYDCDWNCRFETRRCLDEVGPEAVLAEVQRLRRDNRGMSRNLAAQPCTFVPGWRRGGVGPPVSTDNIGTSKT